MSYTIGIDLGTTNSCVAVMKNGNPVVIPNPEGSRTTPSVIAFTDQKEQLIGNDAKKQIITNPESTVASIKRKMGTKYISHIDERDMLPQEVSAMILKKLKANAEDFLSEKVDSAVITVPAYFNDTQRQATKDAGRIAGLNVKRIINEPTAAAIAYGLDHDKDQKVLVYDLGGGTFDVSIISIGEGLIEVLATSGNNKLGGDDFDRAIMEWIAGEFYKREKIDLKKDPVAKQRIKEAAEEAKKALSVPKVTSTDINLPFLACKDNQPKNLSLSLTKKKFNELTRDLVNQTEGPVVSALADAHLKPEDISKVLLVGGSTRIPAVQEKIEELMGQKPSKNLNPDECVAIGAAIQGANLDGAEHFDIVLVDVTPLTLSVETSDGFADNIIKRNTAIPTSSMKIYTTAEDNQDNIVIKVLQGERLYAKDNYLIGEFILDGILPAPKGSPQIEITFAIDVNGILNVTAKDQRTKKEKSLQISNSTKLSEAQIKTAIANARKYEMEDKISRVIADEASTAYDLIDRIDAALNNNNIEVSDADRTALMSLTEEQLGILAKKEPTKEFYEAVKEKNKEIEKKFIEVFTPQTKTSSLEESKKFYAQF